MGLSFSPRDSAIRLACSQPHPGCCRNPISTNTTSTFTLITRQEPAHSSRPEKTADNPVSRCECTLVVFIVHVDADAGISHGRIDRRVHKHNVPSLHRTSPRPYRLLLGRCSIPCLVLHPHLVCPLGLRQALRHRHLRLPLPRTTEDTPLHSVVRVLSACDDEWMLIAVVRLCRCFQWFDAQSIGGRFR